MKNVKYSAVLAIAFCSLIGIGVAVSHRIQLEGVASKDMNVFYITDRLSLFILSNGIALRSAMDGFIIYAGHIRDIQNNNPVKIGGAFGPPPINTASIQAGQQAIHDFGGAWRNSGDNIIWKQNTRWGGGFDFSFEAHFFCEFTFNASGGHPQDFLVADILIYIPRNARGWNSSDIFNIKRNWDCNVIWPLIRVKWLLSNFGADDFDPWTLLKQEHFPAINVALNSSVNGNAGQLDLLCRQIRVSSNNYSSYECDGEGYPIMGISVLAMSLAIIAYGFLYGPSLRLVG